MHSIWLVLVLSFLSCSVRAGTLGDLTYEIADGQVTITDCRCGLAFIDPFTGALVLLEPKINFEIPDEIDGMPVTSIGDGAFADCHALTTITIPDSVTSIGDRAFQSCNALESIVVPSAFYTRAEADWIGGNATRELWGTSGYTTHSNTIQPPTTPTIQPSIRMAPVIMVQGEEGSVKTIEVADSPDGPWQFWMDVTATASGVAITDLDGQAHKRFYRVRD